MLRPAIIILALTALAAAATHWLHPKAPAWYLTQEPLKPDEVDLKTIQERWRGDVLWIDARLREHYEKAHVPGALLLNDQERDTLLAEHFEKLQDNTKPIVIYCDGHACQASRKMRDYLVNEVTLQNVWILRGGWAAWEQRSMQQP